MLLEKVACFNEMLHRLFGATHCTLDPAQVSQNECNQMRALGLPRDG